jgi:hypothetical protein
MRSCGSVPATRSSLPVSDSAPSDRHEQVEPEFRRNLYVSRRRGAVDSAAAETEASRMPRLWQMFHPEAWTGAA